MSADILWWALVLAFILSLVTLLSEKRFSQLTGGAVGLILALSLISPIRGVIEGALNLPEFTPALPSVGDFSSYTAEELTSAIKGYISSTYGIDEGDIEICGEGFSVGELRFSYILLKVGGVYPRVDFPEVRDLLYESFILDGGRVDILLDF